MKRLCLALLKRESAPTPWRHHFVLLAVLWGGNLGPTEIPWVQNAAHEQKHLTRGLQTAKQRTPHLFFFFFFKPFILCSEPLRTDAYKRGAGTPSFPPTSPAFLLTSRLRWAPLRRLGGGRSSGSSRPTGPGAACGHRYPGRGHRPRGRQLLPAGPGEARGSPRSGAERLATPCAAAAAAGSRSGAKGGASAGRAAGPPACPAAVGAAVPRGRRCSPTAAGAEGGEGRGLRPLPHPRRGSPGLVPSPPAEGPPPFRSGGCGGRAPSRAGAVLELPRGEAVVSVLLAGGLQGCGAEAGTRRTCGAARGLAAPSGTERGSSSVSGDRFSAHPASLLCLALVACVFPTGGSQNVESGVIK